MVDVQCDEPLYRRVARFVKAHRSEFDSVVEWLTTLDEQSSEHPLVEAWHLAMGESPHDWKKVLFLTWLLTDERIKQEDLSWDDLDLEMWCGRGWTPQKNVYFATIAAGRYSTPRHPNIYTIQTCLDQAQRWKEQATEAANREPSIVRTPSIWRFRWEGKETLVNGKLKGLRYLAVLLAAPNKKFNPLDLQSQAWPLTGSTVNNPGTMQDLLTSGDVSVGESRQDKADNEAFQDVQAKRAKVAMALEKEQDREKRDSLKQELKKLDDYLRNARYKGRHTAFADEQERARKRISSAVNFVRKKLKEEDESLGNHLEHFLRIGLLSSYTPDRKITWHIE